AVVAADSGGTPGAALETFSSITVPNVGNSSTGMILTEDSQAHPDLVAGTTYWLWLRPHDPTADVGVGWNSSSPVVSGITSAYQTVPNGAWSTIGVGTTQAAFDIAGTPTTAVPEPSSLVIAGVGALVLLLGY